MIQWSREGYRTTRTAELFDIDCHFVWHNTDKGTFNQLVRYLVSAYKTIRIILAAKPKLVIMTNLPIFAPLTALLLRPFLRFELVLDFHSGALEDSFWRKFIPAYKYLCRTSSFTIAHNNYDGATIKEFGGNPIYLKAIPKNFNHLALMAAPENTTIIVICSFTGDEPIHLLIEAMELCEDINFKVTGNYNKVGLRQDNLPENIELLGFLDYGDYIDTIAASTAIMTVSTRDKIMQAAVHEALSVRVPVIANKSTTLEDALGDAGVFANVEPKSIASACIYAAENAALLRENVKLQSEFKLNELREIVSNLRAKYPELF